MSESILETDKFGNKRWYRSKNYHLNIYPKILHRVDGPAVETISGGKHWYLNGKKHRIDGPALNFPEGDFIYCLHGKRYKNQEEWFQHLTSEQKYDYLWKIDEIEQKGVKL